MKISKRMIQRFWSKVNKEGPIPKHMKHLGKCWIWTMQCDHFYHGSYVFIASRFSYEITKGKITDTLFCCHHCDNPKCVNPSHLFLGTNEDNMRDMKNKGRANKPKGVENGRAVLTDKQVLWIRKNYTPGKGGKYNQTVLCKMFGVSQTNMSRIVRGKNWKHL